MAIPLTGTGGLFTRLGRIIYGLNSLNAYLGSSTFAGLASVGVTQTNINNQFLSTDQNVIDNLYLNVASFRSGQTSWESYLTGLAQATLIQMANDDAPLPTKTLPTALALLIAQMGSATASVNQPTTSVGAITAAQADGTVNTGTGTLVASVKSATGKTLDYIFAETVTAICTLDSQNGATARQEVFTVSTPSAAPDVFGYNFPLGSGVTSTITVVDPTIDNSGGNILSNSDFQLYVNTANLPDQWSLIAGTPGTDILKGAAASGAFGTFSFQFLPVSSSVPAIAQTFNSSGGTLGTLLPDTIYAFNVFAKKSSSLVGAGAISFDLINGSNAIITDQFGTANTITKTASTFTTAYTAVNGFFRTPNLLPTTIKLQARVSTTFANAGATVNLCGMSLTPATALYPSGPTVAIFAGPVNFYIPDGFSFPINNNYAGLFQVGLDKFFSLRSTGLAIPSNTSPTISDTLVS